jgi:hypothetical protein
MRRFLQLLLVIAVGAQVGCDVRFADVSNDPRFRQMVRTRYEASGALDAYGMRPHSKAEVEYITLIPPPAIARFEVGFAIRINPGSRCLRF